MKNLYLIIILLAFTLTSSAQDEWELINPFPTLSNLMGTHFVSEQEGWIVGTEGTIMYTNDGCETWSLQHYDTDESFWSIFFINENEGWTVGWSSIYHTTNKGESWEKQTRPDVMGDLTDVFFVNPDTGWIVGTYKIVLKTIDGGENWSKIMNNIYGEKCFYNVTFTDELSGCAVGGEMTNNDKGFAMVTNDGGLTWTDTSPKDCNNLNAVDFLDSNTGWACGINRSLIKTNDGGITWIDKTENTFWSTFNDIHFFNDSTGILFGNGIVRKTFDGGNTWDSIIPLSNYSYIHRFSGWENGGVAVGWAGSVNKTLDSGETWENINSEITSPIREIGFFNSFDGFAISGYGAYPSLIGTNDGGYNWNIDTIIENGPFYKMQILNNNFYLLNNSSQMMKSTDGGVSWELLGIPSDTSHYNDLQFVNENTAYICSGDGILMKTSDGGIAWQNKTLNGEYTLNFLFFIDELKGWMLDYEARVILRTINGGDDWDFGFIGEEYHYQPRSVFFINENEGFVTTSEGILFKSVNGGETWEEFYYFSSRALPDIYFINETEGWYRSGKSVYHTFDGGKSWINDQSFSASLISMFFLDNQGWIGGYNGLVANTNFTVNIAELAINTPSATIFPNPAHDEIEIKLDDKSDKINDIKIVNLQGKLVVHLENLLKSNKYKINISDLAAGTYVIQITSSKSENLVKFIVQ